MGVVLSNKKAFESYLQNIKDKTFGEYIVGELSKYGELFIRDARTKSAGSFQNRTTRLRNSIGYVISYNGKIEKSDFESYSVGGSADEEGKELGRSYATEIAQQTEGYVLVCVAGADYGLYVEAKGYDVITGSVITLKQNLDKWSM